jgi:O-antigen ligase
MRPKPISSRTQRGRAAAASGGAPRRPASSRAIGHRLATWTLWLLLLGVAIVLDSSQKDAFRLPKSLLGQTLALLSLFFLAFAWKGPEEWRRLWRAPFVRAFGPFLVVATVLSLASDHVAHAHRGLVGLWIGGFAVWGWSVGFSRSELRRALTFSLVPAGLLAGIAVLQFHGLYQPYDFVGIAQTSRFAIGSLAGNVGDLAAALVLPVLLAQAAIAEGRRVGLAVAVLILCVYGMAVTQTFSAIAGVAAGSIVFWALRISRRRTALAVTAFAGGVLLLLALLGPFRERTLAKLDQVSRGDWNSVLTGRLDGWRAAVWMLEEHPWTGVGVGAYRTEFIVAKTALLRQGVEFFPDQMNVVFANAHNEILEVAAETGLPGLAALLFGLAMWVRRIAGWRRRERALDALTEAAVPARRADASTALAWAGLVGLGVLSLANFPFRIAIALWPACLFLAWTLSADEEPGA